MYNVNYNGATMVDKNVVDRILEQGQRLRNAMVESILNNDPFNTELIYNKHFNTPKNSSIDLTRIVEPEKLPSVDNKKLEAFLKGDYMTKEDELLALDSLRSMSTTDLCKTTARTYCSNDLKCNCSTCKEYNPQNLDCDIKRTHQTSKLDRNLIERHSESGIAKQIQEQYRSENSKYLHCVDSLKVSVHSLVLNEAGNRKACSSDTNEKYKSGSAQTYFLEYHIPEVLTKSVSKIKSKVDSGLDDSNLVRVCSRRNYNEAVTFKQISIHDIVNLDKLNLNHVELKFNISCRNYKQKHATVLGSAKFCFSSFEVSKNLTCNRGLFITLNENAPIVLGTLKVTLQLGCGKLYFGKEFLDAINLNKPNSVVIDSDDSSNQNGSEVLDNHKTVQKELNNIYEPVDDKPILRYVKNASTSTNFAHSIKDNCNSQVQTQNRNKANPKSGQNPDYVPSSFTEKVIFPSTNVSHSSKTTSDIQVQTESRDKSYFKTETSRAIKPTHVQNRINHQSKVPEKHLESDINQLVIKSEEKQILFGFLYISEAQYLKPQLSSYITCRPFCQDETSNSRLVVNSSNPIFNFCQVIPLVYEDNLLLSLRENYMVIEFWGKTSTKDEVFGLTKVPLHQFYVAYRNPVILKYLIKNKLPVIGTDWWEPIFDCNDEELLGQVQILIALGTEEQVNNLEIERGFKQHVVKAKFVEPAPLKDSKTSEKLKDKSIDKSNPSQQIKDKTVRFQESSLVNPEAPRDDSKKGLEKTQFSQSEKTITTDAGTQSNLEMEEKGESMKPSQTEEMLSSFLSQLITQKQKNTCVENSTNTEEVPAERLTYKQTDQPLLSVNQEVNVQRMEAQSNTNYQMKKTTDLLDSLQQALSFDNRSSWPKATVQSNNFKAHVIVHSALHLPSRKKCKSKKSKSRTGKHEDNIFPSTYVTFETTSDSDLRITPVVAKNSDPTWNFNCDVCLPADMLTNSQKRMIFKVWRKSNNTVMQPNMQTDIVLGFAALDLTVLLVGLPNVQGWFNIVDFSGKCNGQINIHVTPLENLSRYQAEKDSHECSSNYPNNTVDCTSDFKNDLEEPGELLTKTLKRKFTELDEITQRLRLRLSKVTNDDSEGPNDEIADEFERDINTLCIEEDFDLIDFEDEARKFSENHSKEINIINGKNLSSPENSLLSVAIEKETGPSEDSSNSKCGGSSSNVQLMDFGESKSSSNNLESASEVTIQRSPPKCSNTCVSSGSNPTALDKHLIEGKHRIDTLLEKLSLISNETSQPFSSRYVSGCSVTHDESMIDLDTETMLKELDRASRPNIHASSSFDAIMFQQLYGASNSNSPFSSSSQTPKASNSDTSLVSTLSDRRMGPEGQGNTSDEKVLQKITNTK